MTLCELYNVAYYISVCSVALPVIFYFANIKHYPRHMHLIGMLVCASALSDLSVHYLLFFKERSQNVSVIHNTYSLTEFCLLSFFYYEVLLKKHNHTYVNTVLIHCLLSALLFYTFAKHAYFTSRDFLSCPSLGIVLSCIIFIVYAVAFYRLNFTLSEHDRRSNTATLWINGGVLFYFSIAMWAFMLRDKSITGLSGEAIMALWVVHNMANAIKNLMFAKGFYKSRKVVPPYTDSRLIVPQQG